MQLGIRGMAVSVGTLYVCPTGMIFVPCERGVSHNPAEAITPEQAHAGVEVLLAATLELANG
jgi:N-carbamoyl-L-amino-acid hydrolase